VTDGDAATEAPRGLRGRLAALTGNAGLRERVLAPVSFDAAILGTNLVTGIIVARTLGPAGRGQIAATLVLVLTATWLFSVGSTEAVSYRQSRRPEDAPRLIGSWLAVTGLASLIAILAMELLLPVLFGAQSDAAMDLARVYIPVVALTLVIAMFNGILLGDQDFFAYNVIRALIPVSITLGYVALLLFDGFTVEAVLAVNAGATAFACVATTVRCTGRHGVSPPHLPLLRETFWYGIRAHGGSIAGFVNARLDLLILPAFLSAASVGLYSVATNVTSIIGTLTGTVAMFVLPVAARRRQGSARTVIRTLHATLAIGFAIAVPMALLAELAVKLLYGSEFSEAVTALRIMLPGEVLDAGSVVLWAGLLAANRPFLSSAAAGPGAILTIVGLTLFLESGGINAAATVTSCVYVLVFVISLALYRHALDLRWRDFIRVPS
jgi:O-antigen/teichoic acid export membrane protein